MLSENSNFIIHNNILRLQKIGIIQLFNKS